MDNVERIRYYIIASGATLIVLLLCIEKQQKKNTYNLYIYIYIIMSSSPNIHNSSAIKRAQRIRSEANNILGNTSKSRSSPSSVSFASTVRTAKGVKRASNRLSQIVTNVEGKHDVEKTHKSIKSSQSRRGMRQSMDNLFNKINKVETQNFGQIVTPKSVTEAFELLKQRTKDPSCLASIDIIEDELKRSNEAEHKAVMDLHVTNDELHAIRNHLKEVQDQLSTSNSELQLLRGKEVEKNAMDDERDHKMRQLKSSEQIMKNDLEQARAQIRKLQESNDRLRHQVRTKEVENTTDMEKTKAELAWATNELNELKQKHLHATRNLDTLQNVIDNKASTSKSVFEKFKVQNQSLREQVEELSEKSNQQEELLIQVQSLKEQIYFLQNDNTDSTNKHEERMAFIISWLLELHSTNYDENGNLRSGNDHNNLDRSSIQMLNELRQVYDQEMSNAIAIRRVEDL